MSDVSCHAKVLIGAILFHSFDGGSSFPGFRRLEKLCSLSRPSISKAMVELEKGGWLKVSRVDGKPNNYEFVSLSTGKACLPPSEGLVKPVAQGGKNEGGVVVKPVYHNETLNKTFNETKTATPQGAFVEWFSKEYEKRFGTPYGPSKADFIQAANVLKPFFGTADGNAVLKRKVFAGWNDTKQDLKSGFSVAGACMTVKGFCSMVNRITLGPVKQMTAYEREQQEKRHAM